MLTLIVMRRLLVLVAVVATVAACGAGSGYQVWVVNERAEPVVVVVEFLGEDFNVSPDQPALDYTIPARSEGCTYCGPAPSRGTVVLVYTAAGCVQLGAAELRGANSYVITVPVTGLVILDHGGRPSDPSRGRQIQPAATGCG